AAQRLISGGYGGRNGRRFCRILDVREPEEFEQGHLPGAVNVPLHQVGRKVPRLCQIEDCRCLFAVEAEPEVCRRYRCYRSWDTRIYIIWKKGLKPGRTGWNDEKKKLHYLVRCRVKNKVDEFYKNLLTYAQDFANIL
ncbi:MAG: rhodanese-like domain-containing protein, partial [Firmicutes bacterium]|nr:rhodanese-like domain-containing protein [Bacillota bacterium]